MRRPAILAALVSASLIGLAGGRATAAPAPSDWPQYMRGSFHQGLALAESTLTPQSVRGLHVVWRKPLTVSGFAPNTGSVAVVGGVVYVGGADVRAFDASSGALLWQRSVGAPVITTPAFGAGRVVVATARLFPGLANVVALDAATGAVRWSRRLGGQAVFNSVTVAGDRVFVAGGNGTLTAFQLRTGAFRWHAAIAASSSASVGDGALVVDTFDGSRLRALDPRTGRRLWSATIGAATGGGTDTLTPAIAAGTVYAGSVGGDVVALDVGTGAELWRTQLGSPIFRPIAVGPAEVLATAGNRLVALDRATGAVRWAFASQSISPAVAVANGVVYVGVNETEPELVTLREADGAVLARTALGGQDVEPMGPAISRGRVFLPHWDELLALAP